MERGVWSGDAPGRGKRVKEGQQGAAVVNEGVAAGVATPDGAEANVTTAGGASADGA